MILPESKRAAVDERIAYTRGTIDRLVEGMVFRGVDDRNPSDWIEVDGHWGDLRSRAERTGDVESEGWLEVLDLENAIAAMRGDHPQAASVVTLHLHGFTAADVKYIKNYERLLAKGVAYILAYLSGHDPETAYRRRHPSRPRARQDVA